MYFKLHCIDNQIKGRLQAVSLMQLIPVYFHAKVATTLCIISLLSMAIKKNW